MSSKLRPGLLALCCLAVVLPAPAQLDSSALRAKFGAPLNRETFHMPAGFDLTVDYGAGGQVCRMEVPALMPTSETIERIHNWVIGASRCSNSPGTTHKSDLASYALELM